MMTFRWTVRLTKDGHVFKNGEWRCKDCRRRVFELLEHQMPCMSPTVEGEYLFIGGPLDGEWQEPPVPMPKTVHIAIPPIMDLHAVTSVEDDVYETITYTLKRREDKPILAYVYDQ